MSAGLSDEMKADIISGISLGRFADSDEIAEVVGFLASEKSDYITGQLLTIDGGIFK
jgi:3-oxoacyl-[acyl-carrier protein] reductase